MNIFLDCGFYIGHALKKYVEDGIVDESWKVYVFEANPTMKIDYEHFLPIKLKASRKAVWIEDTTLPFIISTRHNASSVQGTGDHDAKRVIDVPAFDFSKFVAKLPKDAYIICSMDIEGSEFEVLRKMLDDHTIERIAILDIEFHHRFMTTKDENDSGMLIKEITDRGVQVKLKVPLI